MQHKSYRKTELTGVIVDLISLDSGEHTELGILTVKTAEGVKTGYGCGRALRSAIDCLYPHGWQGQKIRVVMESHSIIEMERLP